jgi:HEPN domain-containing protein
VAGCHCQQAAEEALKGFLAFYSQKVIEVHDVGLLLERAMAFEPVLGTLQDAADRLTPLATLYRYPGSMDEPFPGEFAQSVDDATTVVRPVLAVLPKSVHPRAEDD